MMRRRTMAIRKSLLAVALMLSPAFGAAQNERGSRADRPAKASQDRSELRRLTIQMQRVQQEMKPVREQIRDLRQRQWRLREQQREILEKIRAINLRQLTEEPAPAL